MTTNIQKQPSMTPDGSPVPEKELQELCQMNNIPMVLGRMCFCLIKGQLYVKIPLLIEKGHQRGMQRVKIERKEDRQNKAYESTVSVFPKVDKEVLKLILQFPKELHKEMWEFYSAPTVGIGRASVENVSNPSMHKFLPELSDKRGFGRSLKMFAGIGHTSYEELPEAVLTEEEIADPPGVEIERSVSSVAPNGTIEAQTVPETAAPKSEYAAKEQESKPAPAVPAAAAIAPASPSSPEQVPEKCPCGHDWKEHFAQRDKVACGKCFEFQRKNKDIKKGFICPLTPEKFEEYKRLLAVMATAK